MDFLCVQFHHTINHEIQVLHVGDFVEGKAIRCGYIDGVTGTIGFFCILVGNIATVQINATNRAAI